MQNDTIQTVSLFNLMLVFVPLLAIVIVILYRWTTDAKHTIYAITRMLLQLALIGYFLTYIFESDSSLFVVLTLAVMLFASSWIALRTINAQRKKLFGRALLSISIGGGITLIAVTQGVLYLNPWYLPQFVVPLAGMIFANSMNSISLAAERLSAEVDRDVPYHSARSIALQASLIPLTNSLLAVGLVSIPGMMTGQILSGISPLIAARYQIMVMCMVFVSAGLSSACFISLVKLHYSGGSLPNHR